MALRKPQLINYLRNKKTEIDNEFISKIHNVKRLGKLDILYKGRNKELLNKFYLCLKEISVISENVNAELLSQGMTYEGYYSCIHHKIMDTVPDSYEDFEEDLLYQYEIPLGADYELEVNKLKQLRDEAKDNYNKLIVYCQNLRSAKQIILHLEEMGFDLTELKEEHGEYVSKDLVPQIDTTKLFIGGLN